ncbi:MAG: hypothetical protein KDC46_14260 [Thermoleophilia bacterium]|nr:hypothetical protein [Thermoleophilia bacterium]
MLDELGLWKRNGRRLVRIRGHGLRIGIGRTEREPRLPVAQLVRNRGSRPGLARDGVGFDA